MAITKWLKMVLKSDSWLRVTLRGMSLGWKSGRVWQEKRIINTILTNFRTCARHLLILCILESINSVFSIVLRGYEYKMKKDKPLTKKEREEKRKKHKEKQLAKK
jgi:hypothetical protein